MTPKEKANELFEKFFQESDLSAAKGCALIAVDEIIASNPIAFDKDDNCIEKQWWKEVKIEIEKL
jgi:hypothetical protein